MDRPIIYPAAIPQDTDLLRAARFGVEGLGALARVVLGAEVAVEGMAVTPTSPATLAVLVEAGAIYAAASLDAGGYGSLAADTRATVQQGMLRDAVTLPITPPATAGQSRVFLVQAQLQVVDADPSVLPYYNAANPSVAWTGPGNSGTPQNTTRAVRAVVQTKAGTPAATGSEVTPSPDAGWTALAAVTVANGSASVVAGNIAQLAVRRVAVRLPDLPVRDAGWRQVITAVGTTNVIVPPGARWARVKVLGSTGGGGGSAGAANSVAAPGGGAGYGEGMYAVTPGATIAVTIGAGGTAGAGGGSPTAGGAGGSTSFGSFLSVTGAAGGGAANGAIQLGGATGGVPTGADFGAAGQAAGSGYAVGSSFMLGQPGGSAIGFAPQPIITATAVNGQPGQLGVGGGGGALSGSGGAGFRGQIIVEWEA